MKKLILIPILAISLSSCAIEGVGRVYYLDKGEPAPEAGFLYVSEKNDLPEEGK